jgi:hypothetical protein
VRDGKNDSYYLAVVGENGRADYQQVRIIEQEILFA